MKDKLITVAQASEIAGVSVASIRGGQIQVDLKHIEVLGITGGLVGQI